jgi:L-lactate dehydrogenase complex protein LldG
MTSSQAEILDKIKRAQYADLDAVEIEEDLREIGQAPLPRLDCDDPLEAFLTRAIVNKMEIEIVQSRGAAVQSISDFLYKEHNTRRVVAGHDSRLAGLPWRDGGVLVRFGTAGPDDPASISFARMAIAECGSLVLYTNRDNPATNNWLVRDHIVVVDSRDLLETYEDAWTRIREDESTGTSPRGISLISGPSSTGDIVGHLVQGAHGPQRLKVVYIDVGAIHEGVMDRARERAAQSKA